MNASPTTTPAVVAAGAAAAALVLAALPWRPRRHRVWGLGTMAGRQAPAPSGTAVTGAERPVPGSRAVRTRGPQAVGAVLCATVRMLGGSATTDPAAHRRIGRSVLAAACIGLISWPGGVLAATVSWWAPVLVARRDRRRTDAALLDELPDLIDLLAVAVAAGANLRLAVEAVAPHAQGVLAGLLDRTLSAVHTGSRLADALEETLVHDPLRDLVSTLVDAERYGTPLTVSLGRLADQARERRRRRAEEAARRLPITLLFPLVLCVLPAFGLLTVVPLLAGSLRSLHL